MLKTLAIILFALALALIFGLEVWLKRRERTGADASRDGGTLKLISRCRNLAFLIAMTSAFYPLVALPGGRASQLLTGATLVFAGFLLRFWAVAKLGPFYTNVVALSAEQRIIKTGPYKYARHPGYSGALLFYLGIGIATGSLWGLVLIMLLVAYAFGRRMKVEEKVMLEAFGQEYLDYMQKTKKLIPRLF